MPAGDTYPRYALRSLKAALEDSPVVLIHGPRQSGKTTLAQMIGTHAGYRYVSFDDEVQLSAAKEDPVGFVADLPPNTILDEIQRAPWLFSALKMAVDRDRSPGRFILTGSTNIFLMPAMTDSLAGRIALLRLFPLAQCEIESTSHRFLDTLFDAAVPVKRYGRLGMELATRIVDGGYPAALARASVPRRAAWYRDYIDILVQRDVRQISRISDLEALPQLLYAAATQTGHMVNVAELGGQLKLTWPTIRDYVNLLERLFLIERIQPWHSNRMKRLIKTPKLHMGDTGLACALLRVDSQALFADRALYGQMVETFVYLELRRLASWQENTIVFHHFRDKDNFEVDIIMERGARELIGIEVKAGATVTAADFRGLNKLRAATPGRFRAGIVLYDGERSVRFGEGLFAVPIRALWG
jgi:predicted AAA+ superfamily ATPase